MNEKFNPEENPRGGKDPLGEAGVGKAVETVEAAEKGLKEEIEKGKKMQADLASELGLIKGKRLDYEGAINSYAEALEADPGNEVAKKGLEYWSNFKKESLEKD